MLTYSSNIADVAGTLLKQVKGFEAGGPNNDKVLRAIADSALSIVRPRIHQQGKRADGQPIGTYSNSYLKYRVKKKNRENDGKVVLSLTRNMENDFQVIATDTGYGLGFNNPDNVKKADWLQNGTKATTVKAHKRDISKRTKRGTIRKGQSERIVNVSAHSRKGWKGYGKVYGLTREERTVLKNTADQIIDELFNA
jgi:hypothetical protein